MLNERDSLTVWHEITHNVLTNNYNHSAMNPLFNLRTE